VIGELWVEAIQSSPDTSCQFRVTPLGTDLIALQGSDGQYLYQSSPQGGNGLNWNKPSMDASCQFRVTDLGNGQIALQGYTGLYFGRAPEPGAYETVQAHKSSIDTYCQFKVIQLSR